MRQSSQEPRSSGRSVLGALVLAIAALLTVFVGAARAEPPNSGPLDVRAVYKITFAGIDIGTFNFRSRLDNRGYNADATAKLSALLGAFQWSGNTRSSGALAGLEPKPSVYNYDFKSNSKTGSVSLGFKGERIASLDVVPAKPPHPEAVPLQEQHLKGVLDPLSAVIALTRTGTANPCDRKLPIFDGKQRFDLALSYRGQRRIDEKRPSGQPGVSFVCAVRYQPIAGHRPDNDETRKFAANGSIEIAMRPVPSANLMVPHHVLIPSAWGQAELRLQRVDISSPGKAEIALVQ